MLEVEGDPRSPINQGTLCPKGAATVSWMLNPNRLTKVKYRAPYSDHWEERPLDWAMERIAQRVKQLRDETFVQKLPDGTTVNHTMALASLGGATLDNEENYLIKNCLAVASAWSGSKTRPVSDTAVRCPVWAHRSVAGLPPLRNGTSPTRTVS